MSTASWITEPDLGSYLENYNFNLNPLVLDFQSDSGATVKEINGAFPPGIRWKQDGSTVVLEGVSDGVSVSTESNVTLRITDLDGTIADRTFYMTITPFGISPSWDDQDSFLGYATIGRTATYTVKATYASDSPITYRLIKPPAGMVIDPKTGVITYVPPSSVQPEDSDTPFDITINFSIRATADGVYETLPAYVVVMTTDHPPAWITVAGRLGEFISGQYLEYYLEAYDPTGENIVYSLTSSPAGFPFTLQSMGFLYGECPPITEDMVIAFTASATTSRGTTSRTFNVLITQDMVNGALTWNSSDPDLGTFTDGMMISIDVGATTTRPSATAYHRFVGGSIPLNLTLNSSNGVIAGYLEYHPRPRSYYFDIEASDGKQTMTRRYRIRIERGIKDQFLNVGLPVMSDIKQTLSDTKMSLISDPSWIPDNDVLRSKVADSANLISGLSFSYDDPYTPVNIANLYLHSTTLNFGDTQYAITNTSGDIVFIRVILDPLQDASYVLSNDSLPYTVYPPSLQNMRRSLSEAVGYANDGRGHDAKLIALIDYEQTSIKGVQVVDGGTGFIYQPRISITGAGTGAEATCTLSVNKVQVIERGLGWRIGDEPSFMVDRYNTISLRITDVTLQGAIVSIEVLDGGSFTAFPYGVKTLLNPNGTNATVTFDLGIEEVVVTNGGSGYNDLTTTVTTQGSEILQSWEALPWLPWVEISTVKAEYLLDVIDNNTDAVSGLLASTTWKLQHLVLTMQGKTWTGSTMFDEDQCTFDGGQTGFTEWLEPIDTVFDLDNTYFDVKGTRFDDNPRFTHYAYRMWGETIFDTEMTIFDLYDTMFDMAGGQTESITVVKKLYRLVSQQVSGNNTVA